MSDEIASAGLVVQAISATEVVAFGRPEELDLLGPSTATIAKPFIDAVRTGIASAPQMQAAVDGLTGRVVRLTADAARLLRSNESMKASVLTGVVRNPATGKIAGHLTFVNPQSLAGLASTLPSIVGGAAMQMQLARIEKSLDELKQDVGYLIRDTQWKVEAGVETNLEILHDVYGVTRRRGLVEDDQWDRVANIEASVRALHKETKKHLRSLSDALAGGDQRLAVRVARLNRALEDDRTLFWLRAHVHAELALARWDAIYLLRQAQQHPDELDSLVARLQSELAERHRSLAELSAGVVEYLHVGGAVSTWTDRLRLVRRSRLRSLLVELDDLLDVFPRQPSGATLVLSTQPMPLGDGTAERKQWDRLVAGARGLPRAAVPALDAVAKHLPGMPSRRRRPDEPMVDDPKEPAP